MTEEARDNLETIEAFLAHQKSLLKDNLSEEERENVERRLYQMAHLIDLFNMGITDPITY